MFNKFSALICSLLLVTFFSCSRNPANMVSFVRNFTETVQTQQNLIFTFNHDIVATEVLGNWDSTEYIKLSPRVEGRFRWASPRELVFSPAKGFKPSTEYKAEFTKNVLKKAGNDKLFFGKEYKTIKFHTEFLQPEAINAFWAKGKDGNGVIIRLSVTFNYDVDPAQLKSLMKITIGGKETSFTPDNTNPGKELFFTINGSPFGKEQSLIVVKFLKGIKLHGGDFTTGEETELSQVLASRYELVISNVESGFKDNRGFIRVVTSQEIDGTNLEKSFSIDPEVSHKAELTENGIYITGDFVINNAYTLTLKKEHFKGALGGVLKADSKHDAFFGEMPPSISFTSKKAIYLSKSGSRNIGVNIVNVPEVKVKIIKIYENNILNYLRGNGYYSSDYYYSDYYEEEGYYNDYGYNMDNAGMYSSVVLERTIKTTDLPRMNGIATLNLDIPQVDEFKGIYVVEVSSKTDYYLNANKLVSVSDIGVISKMTENDLFIYTNSILTAQPMGDVDLHIISNNNQDVFQVKTDGKGIAVIKDFKAKMRHFSPAMITSRKGDDFNYLLLGQTGVETSRFDVSGKREHSTGLDVFIYGDRNLYRPGEKVFFNAVVRNTRWEPMGDVPMKVKIVMPNGKEYAAYRKNTNAQGAIEGSFDIAVSAVTGNYTIEVYNGNDVLLESKSIGIEEFMPDRIKNTLTLNKTNYMLTDKIEASIEAVNYFGPPAANRNYEMELRLNRKDFRPKKYSDYYFDITAKQTFMENLRTGTTNDAGRATQTFELAPEYKDMGVLEATVYATVFDESGRPVNRSKRVDVFTQNVLYGIKLDDYYLKTNEPMQAKLVAVDKDGNGVNAKGQVDVIQYEWQSVLTRGYNDNYYYTTKRVERNVSSRVISFSKGEALFTYIPPFSGSYEIRVKREGAERYVAYDFYAYRWGSTLATSFDVNTEGTIDVVFDKEKYEVGDVAKVLFKTPFVGKLLVTIERNGIYDYRVVETDKKSAEIEVPIKDEFLPNVYISATLIKPLTNSGIPLMVAHGYGNLPVEKKSTILPVAITAVEKSRSSTKQKITVKTKAESGIQVTVAVVDEGILSLKNYQTPDPHGHFYARRALEVQSYDLYPYLFPELGGKSSTGGDGYDLEKRVNPMANNRVKLVAFWSGILTTNSNGEVSYEVDLPKFSGDLRIMAVAYKNNSFGSGDKHMKVADPLVVTTGLPRFFSPGDEILMPVNISNTTAKNASSKVTVTITGPVQADGSSTETITVNANKENLVTFKLKALSQIGEAKIKVAVNGLGETFTDETEITVRPSTSLLKTTLAGTMKPGETKDLELNPDYMPGSAESKLVLSKNPMVEFIDRFSYLVHYPHGCAEQTTSAAFPQIYLADFVKSSKMKNRAGLSSGEDEMNPAANVRAAIRKLQGMQMYDGSISYWIGDYYASWWTSVYVSHFLIEAKNAGYDVNNDVLERLLDHVTYRTGNKELEEYRYYSNGAVVTKKFAPREMIYSLYVLARAGRPNRPLMNYYKGNKDLLTIDERYMLAAAYALISDKVSFAEVLPPAFIEADNTKSTGGSFYSPIRNLAISLHALVESDINHKQIPVMARNLTTQLKNDRYASTQELVFSFLALGKLAQAANKADVSAIVKAGGKTVGNFSNNELVLQNSQIGGQKLTISSSGTGTLYYYYEMEGISASGKYEEIDNYLRVRKDFFDRFGRKLNGNTFKQNDLVVVRISIASLNNMDIDNVVVTDMLPAGFEIENPRVTEGRDFEWTTDRANTQHFDVRDDRINFYLDPTNREQYIYYTVRAVTRGKFVMGPVSADAMYNGEYRSYNGAGTVTVE